MIFLVMDFPAMFRTPSFAFLLFIILKKSIGIAGFQPRRTVLIFKYASEFFCLALPGDELLQLGDLQVLSIEAEVVVEHLGKDAQHRRLVLVYGALDVDVEQDGIRMSSGSSVDEHEGGRIIRELLPEALHGLHAVHLAVLQQVGQHFQEVGFTTPEEAGDPDADVSRVLIEGFSIVVEKRDKVLLQLSGDDVFIQFLNKNCLFVLIDFDDAVDLAVDVVFVCVIFPGAEILSDEDLQVLIHRGDSCDSEVLDQNLRHVRA